MPVDTIDIYVDSSFYSPSDYEDDITIAAQLVETADVIGAANLPIVVNLSEASITSMNVNVSLFTASGTTNGTVDRAVDTFIASTTTSGDEDVSLEYSTGTIADFFNDTDIDVFVVNTSTSGYNFVTVDFIGGQQQSFYVNTPINYWFWTAYDGEEDFEVDFSYIEENDFTINFDEEVKFSTLTSGSLNEDVDITFAGYVFYDLPFVISSTVSGIKYLDFDVDTTTSGNVLYCVSELYCTTSGMAYFDTDLFCCASGIKGMYVDIDTTTSGAIKYINYDLYCTLRNVPSVLFDIDLYSLKISNFYPEIEDYVEAEDIISVDVTDDVYNVVTSGTYFTVSGTRVPVTFDPITDGYRMYYDAPNDYDSLLGSTDIMVHAENNNSDILEQFFYITYGYRVLYEG